MAVFLIFFGNSNIFFAGGEDKIVYLSDGSRMIYISTERIPEILEEYKQRIIENQKRKFSTKKNLSFKAIGLGILGLGVGAGAYLKNKTGSDFLAFAGGLVGTAIGGVTFFWPEWVAHDVETTENCERTINRTDCGLKATIKDIEHVIRAMNSKGSIPLGLSGTIKHGIIILERPKSKWGKRIYTKNNCYTIYEILDCQNDSTGNPQGTADFFLGELERCENVRVIKIEKR
jgi:hypothetical protein